MGVCFVWLCFPRGWTCARRNYGLELRRQKCELLSGKHYVTVKSVQQVKECLLMEGEIAHKTRRDSIQNPAQIRCLGLHLILINLKKQDVLSTLHGNIEVKLMFSAIYTLQNWKTLGCWQIQTWRRTLVLVSRSKRTIPLIQRVSEAVLVEAVKARRGLCAKLMAKAWCNVMK